MNNPINFNDPTGHERQKYNPCRGAGSGYKCNRNIDKARVEERTRKAHAEKLAEVLLLALLGYDEIQLYGDAVELIKNDPSFLEFQGEILLKAMSHSEFGKSYFEFIETTPTSGLRFGDQRSFGDMFDQLLLAAVDPDNPKLSDTWASAKNPLTWMLRYAHISARVDAYEDKQVLISYFLWDTLDLEPQEGRNDMYNDIVGILGPPWRDGLGASEPKVYANWSILIDLNINLSTTR